MPIVPHEDMEAKIRRLHEMRNAAFQAYYHDDYPAGAYEGGQRWGALQTYDRILNLLDPDNQPDGTPWPKR